MELYREVEDRLGNLVKVQLRPPWFVVGPFKESRYFGTCGICPAHVAAGQWSGASRPEAEAMAEAHHQQFHYPVSG